jgi:hypothetical protein
MKARLAGGALLVGCLAVICANLSADEIQSGPAKKIGGAFQVKAFTGDNKGKQLCYV